MKKIKHICEIPYNKCPSDVCCNFCNDRCPEPYKPCRDNYKTCAFHNKVSKIEDDYSE